MRKKSLMMVCTLCIISGIIVSCGNSNKEKENPEKGAEVTADDEKTMQESVQVINEKLDENLYINVQFEMPTEKLNTYTTELKQFSFKNLQSLFWNDEQSENIYEDEFGSMHCGNSSLGGERGALIYRKNSNASYIDTICSYCKEKKCGEEKSLSFMSIEEAKTIAADLIINTGIGGELEYPSVISLNADDVANYLTQLMEDEEYKNVIPSDDLTFYGLNESSEIYCLEYSFHIGDTRIYGMNDPVIQMNGDIPLLAHPMMAKVILSNDGIELVQIMGGVDAFEKTANPANILGYDGIKDCLLRKYGDVILTQKYEVTKVWMEYFPLIKKGSFYEIDLVPVWCCDFEIDGKNEGYTLRFNAVTGEEIS